MRGIQIIAHSVRSGQILPIESRQAYEEISHSRVLGRPQTSDRVPTPSTPETRPNHTPDRFLW